MHNQFVTPAEVLRQDADTTPRRAAPERLRFASPALPVPHLAASEAPQRARQADSPAKNRGSLRQLLDHIRRRPMVRPIM